MRRDSRRIVELHGNQSSQLIPITASVMVDNARRADTWASTPLV